MGTYDELKDDPNFEYNLNISSISSPAAFSTILSDLERSKLMNTTGIKPRTLESEIGNKTDQVVDDQTVDSYTDSHKHYEKVDYPRNKFQIKVAENNYAYHNMEHIEGQEEPKSDSDPVSESPESEALSSPYETEIDTKPIKEAEMDIRPSKGSQEHDRHPNPSDKNFDDKIAEAFEKSKIDETQFEDNSKFDAIKFDGSTFEMPGPKFSEAHFDGPKPEMPKYEDFDFGGPSFDQPRMVSPKFASNEKLESLNAAMNSADSHPMDNNLNHNIIDSNGLNPNRYMYIIDSPQFYNILRKKQHIPMPSGSGVLGSATDTEFHDGELSLASLNGSARLFPSIFSSHLGINLLMNTPPSESVPSSSSSSTAFGMPSTAFTQLPALGVPEIEHPALDAQELPQTQTPATKPLSITDRAAEFSKRMLSKLSFRSSKPAASDNSVHHQESNGQ